MYLRLDEINTTIKEKESSKALKENLYRNYVANGLKEKAAEAKKEIEDLNTEVTQLGTLKTNISNDLAAIETGEVEKEMSQEVTSILNQIQSLQSQKENTIQQLEKCRKEAERVR